MKTYTPTLDSAVLDRLRDYVALFADEFPQSKPARWAGVYPQGLLLDGERKSIEPLSRRITLSVHRTPAPGSATGDPETQVLKLTKVDGTRATYRGVLTRTPEGDYQFTLSDPDAGGPKPRAEAKVLPPRGEREQTDLNRADLTQAAALSRGKFYTLAEADGVFADLPDVPRVPLNQPVPPVPLWNRPAVYLLVFGLLVAEWLLRRRERLL